MLCKCFAPVDNDKAISKKKRAFQNVETPFIIYFLSFIE